MHWVPAHPIDFPTILADSLKLSPSRQQHLERLATAGGRCSVQGRLTWTRQAEKDWRNGKNGKIWDHERFEFVAHKGAKAWNACKFQLPIVIRIIHIVNFTPFHRPHIPSWDAPTEAVGHLEITSSVQHQLERFDVASLGRLMQSRMTSANWKSWYESFYLHSWNTPCNDMSVVDSFAKLIEKPTEEHGFRKIWLLQNFEKVWTK